MTYPHLTHDEVVQRVMQGTLPEAFVTIVEGRSLHPLFAPGSPIIVERTPIEVGDLVALLSGKRVAFRRVLATRGTQLLVRADIAPWPDGWVREPLGRVRSTHRLAKLAARFPRLWTHAGWTARTTMARLRTVHHDASTAASELRARLLARWTPASEPSEPFLEVRPLGIEDRVAASRYLVRPAGLPGWPALDVSHGQLVHPHVRGSRGLGLFAGPRLVGAYWVVVEGTKAFSHDLFVDPAFRGHGGGLRLVRAVLAEAARCGATLVCCHVAVHNVASLRTHQRGGFKRTKRWAHASEDPLASAERQLLVLEADVATATDLEADPHIPGEGG